LLNLFCHLLSNFIYSHTRYVQFLVWGCVEILHRLEIWLNYNMQIRSKSLLISQFFWGWVWLKNLTLIRLYQSLLVFILTIIVGPIMKGFNLIDKCSVLNLIRFNMLILVHNKSMSYEGGHLCVYILLWAIRVNIYVCV